MNSSSVFKIFEFLLFAYYAPTQGAVLSVYDSVLENGPRCRTDSRWGRSTRLIRLPNDYYELEETLNPTTATEGDGFHHEYGTFIRAKFQLKGIDTMLDKAVVAITDDNKYFEVETLILREAQRLFNFTTYPKLGEPLYSYKVAAVCQHQYGRILKNVTISGFKYATAGNPQERHIIHAGNIDSNELEPHVLWTGNNFYYFDDSRTSIILTLKRRGYGSYRYYLVRFNNASDLTKWIAAFGQNYDKSIPAATPEVMAELRRSAK